MKKLTLKQLEASVGGLTNTSKMPCQSYGLPAGKALHVPERLKGGCNVGSRLIAVKNSVCSDCYACKGLYMFKNTKEAQINRLTIYREDPDKWENTMVEILSRKKNKYFRWLDSGDILDMDMLLRLIRIAEKVKDTKFWLPTKEQGLIKKLSTMVISGTIEIPNNLTIRLSMPKINQKVNPVFGNLISYSAVSSQGEENCPAPTQNGFCGDCRSCWDKNKNVTYKKH